MKLVTTAEMRKIEQAADKAGLGYDLMMENAGRSGALAIRERFPQRSVHVLILVGPGNNGGDGLVTARYLHERGYRVTVYIWKRSKSRDPNLTKARELNIPIIWSKNDGGFRRLDALLQESDVLVDALLGTGVTGPLRGSLRELLGHARRGLDARTAAPDRGTPLPRPIRNVPPEGSRPLVVAIDVPSGLNCDTGEVDDATLRADLTVTFAYPKRGQFLFPGADCVGELLVADIGVDPSLAEEIRIEVATPEEIAHLLPKRPLDAHKGSFGKALIVAGSTNYVGAPCLAAEAAYRSGAGLVTLAVAESIYPIVAAKLTEPTFLVLPDDMGVLVPGALPLLADRMGEYDVLLVGPGLGRERTTGDFVSALLSTRQYPGRRPVGFDVSSPTSQEFLRLPAVVLDADGLNLLADDPDWWKHMPPQSVLTPHPGEMARLVGYAVQAIRADRIGTARAAAEKWGCTVALKGAYTVVASSEGKATIIPFANPALATAGTGDVLAGAIAGLMAQGLSGHSAAICGAYIHGLAGEMNSQWCGPTGMLASDLLTMLPRAIEQLRHKQDTGHAISRPACPAPRTGCRPG